ncbi:gamma-glutamyltransferase family protein [Oryzibacter oryziterrae]|uniref:gamma-glutamyltransferase family protein n=1 Tax=Oryzibacter oryziterrae TaxID=2766474 RepID=UPI001F43E86F|nr:gamma-glutamyltransferase family protein [Oryzibacter oryziterrae]
MRDFEKPTRSTVVAREAMAATSHPSATLAALRILEAGGNAMDAAIAACAVQCVVEPGSTGIGGDCFVLYAPQGSDKVIAYNGSGRAPAGLTLDWFRARGLTSIPRNSAGAVTIPGAIDAWTRLHGDHGSLPFARLLSDAIRFAEDGYAVAPRVHRDWAIEETFLTDPSARRIFLKDGRAPAIGSVHRQPELAGTLRKIAVHGRDAFYTGEVAEDMVSHLNAHGGPHTLEDFATAAGEYVTPIRTVYRDHEIHECPPNGQGVIALMILNILSRFPATGDPSGADRLHVEIEATRLAYAARAGLLADPRVSPVPVEELLSDAMADRLAGMIDLTHALPELPAFDMPLHRDTVYVTVVDKDRNAVSFINSIFDFFGSGIVAPRSGVTLHNRGESFSLDPNHPNVVAPGKRPLHTIIPGMVTRGGKVVMPFGVMGGYYQAMGHAHLVSKILDYGLDPQMAIDLPRVVPVSGKLDVEAEKTLDPRTAAELERRGFRIVPSPDPIGGAQAIRIDWQNGTLAGASESRKDGCALGL